MKKLLIMAVLSGTFLQSEAFRIEGYYHEQLQWNYTAYCFNKAESDQIKQAITAGAELASAIALIPQAAPVAKTIAGVLGGLNFVIWLNTHGGTGFSLNVPDPKPFNPLDFLLNPKIYPPFLWPSNG